MRLYYALLALLGFACLCLSASAQDATTDSTASPSWRLEPLWQSNRVFKTPESVCHDPKHEIFYVSNINKMHVPATAGDGFISTLGHDGTVKKLEWFSGLNDPKGLALYKGSLFVADINELVEIDVAKGALVKRYTVNGAENLNDVTISEKGRLLLSDSRMNRIYTLDRDLDSVVLWFENPILQQPNGLLLEKTQVLVASMGIGQLYRINLETNALESFAEQLPSPDGIVTIGKGEYLVTDWNGAVYHVTHEGQVTQLLNTHQQKMNTADLCFVKKGQWVLVPTFFDNRVVAYSLKPAIP